MPHCTTIPKCSSNHREWNQLNLSMTAILDRLLSGHGQSVETNKQSSIIASPIEEEYLNSAIVQEKKTPLCFGFNQDCLCHRLEPFFSEYIKGIKYTLAAILGIPRNCLKNSGFFWYRPGDFMGWHTNANDPGTRVYVALSDQGTSFFRYYNEGKGICTDFDGLNKVTIRKFSTSPEDPLWHCVRSNCNRVSIGFKILGETDAK